MGLKTKSILAVNAIVIVACVLMGIIGYFRAEEGFAKALEMKAAADVQSLTEIVNNRYYGDWHLQNGILFKGAQQIDGVNEIADFLSNICNGKVTIFNGDTRVITTVKDSAGNRQVGTKASEAVIDNVITQGKFFVGKASVMGEDHYAAYQPIKDATGKTIGMLFVGISVHEMDAVTDNLILSIALAVVVIVILCGLASNFFIGKMVRQIEEVGGAMKKISGGNLRINDLEIKSDDELGALSESVNDMKIRLKNLLTKIAECSERVVASSEELTAGTQQTNESINVVAQSMEVLSSGTAEQEKTIGKLEEKIQDMHERMDDLRATAKDMEQIALDSANNATLGKEKVDVAIAVMKNIAEQVSSSAQVIGELGRRSDEIGQIVGTISGIAGQTNLLALNAAIEAARAGEQGRGFAVVAEEVRKLAEQSGEASDKIAKLIATVQADTNSAVESIELGNQSVKDGIQSVAETGAAFVGIETQAAKLNTNVAKSLEDIIAVDASNKEIISAVEHVKEIAIRSSDNASSVRAATQEQTATMQEVADASKTLSELANDMHGEVAQFKL
ncbi:MAG: cache domain-containing protein [Selenomonadaceae bacterium]|nr:cache domain-containing protein [Selenomonadaceae bacterium]MBR7024566.1 cache domain-containing protein [Selenomonadaceae bacterium]